MLQAISNQLDFNYAYAKQLVHDLDDNEMTVVPSKGLENHAAFTLGHLITGAALTIKYLGESLDIPDGWEALFLRKGPGDPRFPDKDASKYPSKLQLLEELARQHEHLKKCLENSNLSDLSQTKKVWRFENHMPMQLDCILFMCVNHEAMHLGQLAAWRRALGKDAALAKL